MAAMSAVTAQYIADSCKIPYGLAERILAHAGRPMDRVEFHSWIQAGGAADLPSAKLYWQRRRAEERWKAKKTGRVYFIEAIGADRIKVGFTSKRTAVERLRNLQTSCPFPLRELVSFEGTMLDEFNLHQRFASARVAPNIEWFHATPELLAFIAERST